MKKSILLMSCLTFCGFQHVSAETQHSDTRLINQCRSVTAAIEKYTQLKRKGGDSKQMNLWHKKRNEQKKRYSQLDCKRVRQHLN